MTQDGIFGLVDPDSFGHFRSLVTHLVLIFILFESGTDLKIAEIKNSFAESAGITMVGFITTWIVSFVFCTPIFMLSWQTSLFIGATLGGTSSAVVIGLMKKISVTAKTSTGKDKGVTSRA